ncbi:MAG: hypothetical protein AAGC74_00195 [Verrucomicrobiota bacterium]
MKRSFILAILLSLSLFSSARTWTSADGEKTFEGELQEYDPEAKTVTVLTNGRSLSFDESKLSEEDITFVQEWHAEKNKPKAEEVLAAQKVGAKLTYRVVSKLDGDQFKKYTLEEAPEYYLLYFSASW